MKIIIGFKSQNTLLKFRRTYALINLLYVIRKNILNTQSYSQPYNILYGCYITVYIVKYIKCENKICAACFIMV